MQSIHYDFIQSLDNSSSVNELCEQFNFNGQNFFSKVPFDECSAAMGFQVGFKSVGFFSVFKGYCVFDAPRFVFGCVRNIAFVVFFQKGF